LEATTSLPERILKGLNEIPPLPNVVIKLMKLIRDPETTAKQLTDLISQDQALTSNILRLCNSSYYGMPRVVSSLSQAIMYLGFHTVRNLVITCSLRQLFNPEQEVYGYKAGGIWFHAVCCAITSQMICKKVHPDVSDSSFTGGLLHDIGQLVMAITIKDTAETIIELMNNGVPELEAEKVAVGISHDHLGAILANNWNFPDDLVFAIRYHHVPNQSKRKSILTSIVHLADTIVLDLGYGIEMEQMKYPPQDFAMNLAKVDEDMMKSFRDEAEELIESHAEHFMVKV